MNHFKTKCYTRMCVNQIIHSNLVTPISSRNKFDPLQCFLRNFSFQRSCSLHTLLKIEEISEAKSTLANKWPSGGASPSGDCDSTWNWNGWRWSDVCRFYFLLYSDIVLLYDSGIIKSVKWRRFNDFQDFMGHRPLPVRNCVSSIGNGP